VGRSQRGVQTPVGPTWAVWLGAGGIHGAGGLLVLAWAVPSVASGGQLGRIGLFV
jgi:hypothetical protein